MSPHAQYALRARICAWRLWAAVGLSAATSWMPCWRTTLYRIDGWDPQVEKISRHLSNPHLNLRQNSLSSEDLPEFREAIRAADAVVNLAAICNPSEYNVDPIGVIDANFLQPVKIVDICAEQRKWLIHFSTSEIYGRTIANYVSDTDYANPDLYELDEDSTSLIMGPIRNQRWSYATSKQLMERHCREL